MYSEETERDIGKTHFIETEDGRLIISMVAPHSFWKVSSDNGRLPDNLAQDTFTSLDLARRAAEAFLKGRGREVLDFTQTPSKATRTKPKGMI